MRFVSLLCLLLTLLLSACMGPDYNAIANRLRETTIQQEAQIASLKEQLSNRDATIRDLQSRAAANLPPLQSLPASRLADLITASRLEIRSQTDIWDFNNGKGKSGFRVFIRAYSADDQPIPATGSLIIEAFETPFSPGEPKRLGAWTFSPQQMKKAWMSGFGLNHFAFDCPWTTAPTQSVITFKARLQDSLTGQIMEAQTEKRISGN